MKPEDIIAALKLKPHPEGGHFAETFRDAGSQKHERGLSTAIYYLLRSGEASHWHRVDAAEVWHFYAGDPLELRMAAQPGNVDVYILGPDIANGQRPQIVVPANTWQAARSLGQWSLTGCTVAPAFRFSGFEMAPRDWDPLTARW